MFRGSPTKAPGRLLYALIAASVLCAPLLAPRATAQAEVRALWVVRTTMTSLPSIDAMIASARAGGFNTLLVQVRGRADAYYSGGVEPRPPALALQPAFDPLAATIARAHDAGLQVHAWVNVNLVAGAAELPSARDHVMYRHPEWLMVPRELANDLAALDPKNPEYIGRLARYVRNRTSDLEGLYLSPAAAGAQDYTVGVVREIAERYAVDGIHLDYIRYPAEDFDYSAAALAAFRRSVLPDLRQAEQDQYEARAAQDPSIYAEAFPDRWRAFRTAELTRLVVAIRRAVKAARPAAILSAAVSPDPAEALAHRLQDWRGWLEQDLLDVVCPMAYTADRSLFATQVIAARTLAGRHGLWAGIGAFRLSSAQIIESVQAARRAGVNGVILFSYDSLIDPSRGPEYLAEVGRAAFMQ